MTKLTALILAFLILILITGMGAASEIIVNPGNSIQNSINSATPGDIIIIEPGTYNENVIITKNNLTIKSQTGNPDDTIIEAKSTSSDVFLLDGDNTKIQGFKICGATGSGYSGIHLHYNNNCTIEDNELFNNSCGICIWYSTKNIISNNTVNNNGASGGVLFATSNFNTLSGNTISNNQRGIYFETSNNNTLSSNIVQNNDNLGLFVCGKSNGNHIYNNYFNETVITIENGIGNAYNITKTAGTNIVGGPYIGGNYWAKPDGTGFSQKAVDKNGDGISDSAYTRISGSRYSDFLPIVIYKPPEPIIPVASFWGSPRSGEAPLNVTFTDISTGTPTSWNWSFGDGTYSTDENPVHAYSTAGTYSVTLTDSNAAGNDSIIKSSYVTVLIPPVASFTASTTSGKAPLTVTFTDKSTNTPTSWNWSFGDKSTSTAKNPVHKYTQTGKFTVTLTSSNAAGSNSIIKSSYITVLIPPVASFTASTTSGKAPITVTFTDKSTNNPTAWSWSFGDKSTSTAKNPVHKYTQTGKYTVTLISSNTAGSNSVTKSGYITVK
jgi:parallel beta-helix repeat protein